VIAVGNKIGGKTGMKHRRTNQKFFLTFSAWMFLARFRGQGDAWVAPAYSCPRKASTMQMSAIQIP